MSFKYADSQNITVKELKEKVTGRFDFIAAFKWIGQEKIIKVKKKKKREDGSVVSQRMREGVAIDHSNSYMIPSVWNIICTK